jgi:hypothetical protein
MMSLAAEFEILLLSTTFFGSVLLIGRFSFGTFIKGSFLISTVHAVSILMFTANVIFSECWTSIAPSCGFDSIANSDSQQFLLLFSMGYFTVDSFVVLWLAPDVSASLHHVSILVGLISTIFYVDLGVPAEHRMPRYQGAAGYPLACFLFAAEISAPFLNAFMSGAAPKDSRFEFISKALFALTFLVSRLLICPLLTYQFVMNCPSAPLIPKLVCIFVMGISIYWSKAIISGIAEAVNPVCLSQKEELLIQETNRSRLKGE